MLTFRRSLRIFFGLAGFLLGATVAAAAFLARTLIAPVRQGLWATPTEVGLPFENAEFPAQDGVRLSGWFVPAASDRTINGATIVLVHGWQWNRLGYRAQDLFANVTGSTNIDLLSLIQDLHREGYNVLTFDLRNHGQSAAARPVSFGQSEAKDLLGALAYLDGRDDVDASRIGVLGFSIGANAALFALPQTDQIRALVAVQPMTPSLFTVRLTSDFLSFFGSVVRGLAEMVYRLFGGPRMEGIVPAFAAAGAGDTPVLFLQGTGDRWGSTDDISRMAEVTPRAQELLFVNSTHRFGGYQYLIDHSAVASNFFQRTMPPV
jgi:alpha-beta hydrolase superfamily lysophospholipase